MTWINARGSRLILPKFTFSKKQRKILNKKDIIVPNRRNIPMNPKIFGVFSNSSKKDI